MAMLASTRLRSVTAVTAAAILAAGLLLKPDAPAAPPPDEAPAPILQQVVEQREADAVFRRMRTAAPQAVRFAARLVPLHPRIDAWSDWQADRNQRTDRDRFGVIAGSRQLLGHAADLDDEALVRATLGDGRTFVARVTTRFVSRGLAVLEPTTDVQLDSPPRREDALTAGTAVFAAAPGSGGSIVAPLFVAAVTPREVLTTNALDALQGMPVFTLEGDLVGIVATEERRARVLTLDAAIAPAPMEAPRERWFGFSLAVQPRDGRDVVAVTDVAPSGPADRAGIEPGDLIIAVGGQEITSIENAVAALSDSDALAVTIRRGSRVRDIRLSALRAPSP